MRSVDKVRFPRKPFLRFRDAQARSHRGGGGGRTWRNFQWFATSTWKQLFKTKRKAEAKKGFQTPDVLLIKLSVVNVEVPVNCTQVFTNLLISEPKKITSQESVLLCTKLDTQT